MSIIHKVIRKFLVAGVPVMGRMGLLSPLAVAKLLHWVNLGRFPNLRHPRDYNEKTIWLEFNSDTSQWPRLADKYEVREYLKEKGLAHLLPEVYGLYETSDEIDFDALPDKFVLKPTHSSGQVAFIKDKGSVDLESIRKEANRWLKTNLGKTSGEPHYGRIRPRIYAEEYLESKTDGQLLDYKIYCFDSKPMYCIVCSNRKASYSRLNMYTLPEWDSISNQIVESRRGNLNNMPAPGVLPDLLSYAAKLSMGFPTVRMDFYIVDGKILFGEMTMSPWGGRNPYILKDFHDKMGDMIKLPAPESNQGSISQKSKIAT